jgi:hypothetical protein
MRRTIGRSTSVALASAGKVVRDNISCEHNSLQDKLNYENTHKYNHLRRKKK